MVTRPHLPWRAAALWALLVTGLVAAALMPGKADARAATKAERPAMIAAWYAALGNFDPPRCRSTWVTLVSSARPRIGVIFANLALRRARDCMLGDGYGILRRPTATSTRWKVVWQGSGQPPCRLITTAMARELRLPTPCTR